MKISLIVPIFNSENTIGRLLDSVNSQKYENYEVICVNDGSVDNSELIVKKYVFENPRIKLINTTNQGVSHARNIGLSVVSGDIITFADSDDELSQDFFNVISTEMKNSDILVFGFENIVKNLCSKKYQLKTKTLINYNSFYFYLMNNHAFSQAVWNKAFSKKLIIDKLNVINFNEKIYISEDALFVANCINKAKKIKLLNMILYHRFLNPNGITQTNPNERIDYKAMTMIDSFEQILLNSKESNASRFIRKQLIGLLRDKYFTAIKEQDNCKYELLRKIQFYMKDYSIRSLRDLMFVLKVKVQIRKGEL